MSEQATEQKINLYEVRVSSRGVTTRTTIEAPSTQAAGHQALWDNVPKGQRRHARVLSVVLLAEDVGVDSEVEADAQA